MNLQPNEVLIILVVALIVLGPQRLPTAARKIGEGYREFKRISTSVKAEFDTAVEAVNAPIREVSSSVEDTVRETGSLLDSGTAARADHTSHQGFRPADELDLEDDAHHDRMDDV